MRVTLGLFLIFVVIVFFITFIVEDDLNTKEKIKLALGIILLLAVLLIGVSLIAQ